MDAAGRRYKVLLGILDAYLKQAKANPKSLKRFQNPVTDDDKNQARARAYIHLYLEARYGLSGFTEREAIITDGQNDGGIDAYYIDENKKRIDVIQSKFRCSTRNFEEKSIEPQELARIDIERILGGMDESDKGKKYNGKVQGLLRRIAAIPDIARYSAQITLLANTDNKDISIIQRLFSKYCVEVYNFQRCYEELVLPILRGEQFYGETLRLQIDLSNKASSPRLSAEVETKFGTCEVTVVLVPTIEIAQLMGKYKNSILRYNPRSYLEFKEQRTNEGIRSSIVSKATGEFALLNNGITIVSDETFVNERIGARNKSQVELINPQIINGGQTAFTLSRIFDDAATNQREALFRGKEVVVRIITLPPLDAEKKKDLIFEISSATNSQTQVSAIDRSASNDFNRDIAAKIFCKTGLLYEPRRGEYSNAIYAGHVDRIEILERSLFTRLIFMAEGKYATAVTKKMMKTTGGVIPRAPTDEEMDRLVDLYSLYLLIAGRKSLSLGNEQLAVLLAMTNFAYQIMHSRMSPGEPGVTMKCAIRAKELWEELLEFGKDLHPHLTTRKWHAGRQEEVVKFNAASWILLNSFPSDARSFLRHCKDREINGPQSLDFGPEFPATSFSRASRGDAEL